MVSEFVNGMLSDTTIQRLEADQARKDRAESIAKARIAFKAGFQTLNDSESTKIMTAKWESAMQKVAHKKINSKKGFERIPQPKNYKKDGRNVKVILVTEDTDEVMFDIGAEVKRKFTNDLLSSTYHSYQDLAYNRTITPLFVKKGTVLDSQEKLINIVGYQPDMVRKFSDDFTDYFIGNKEDRHVLETMVSKRAIVADYRRYSYSLDKADSGPLRIYVSRAKYKIDVDVSEVVANVKADLLDGTAFSKRMQGKSAVVSVNYTPDIFSNDIRRAVMISNADSFFAAGVSYYRYEKHELKMATTTALISSRLKLMQPTEDYKRFMRSGLYNTGAMKVKSGKITGTKLYYSPLKFETSLKPSEIPDGIEYRGTYEGGAMSKLYEWSNVTTGSDTQQRVFSP